MKSSSKFESPKKVDTKIRKSGVPTALKKSPQAPIVDCFLQAYFHIPTFVEYILSYDVYDH